MGKIFPLPGSLGPILLLHHPRIPGGLDAALNAGRGRAPLLVAAEGPLRLLLSTWQDIFLGELDGPRTRRVIVRVNGG